MPSFSSPRGPALLLPPAASAQDSEDRGAFARLPGRVGPIGRCIQARGCGSLLCRRENFVHGGEGGGCSALNGEGNPNDFRVARACASQGGRDWWAATMRRSPRQTIDSTIPIVWLFLLSSRTGFLASLARPGGNVTGAAVSLRNSAGTPRTLRPSYPPPRPPRLRPCGVFL